MSTSAHPSPSNSSSVPPPMSSPMEHNHRFSRTRSRTKSPEENKEEIDKIHDKNEECDSKEKDRFCPLCARHFTVFRARHICRKCGTKVCDVCSKNKMKVDGKKTRRICNPCASMLLMEEEKNNQTSMLRSQDGNEKILELNDQNNGHLQRRNQEGGCIPRKHVIVFYFLIFCIILRYCFGHERYENISILSLLLHGQWMTSPSLLLTIGMFMVQRIVSVYGFLVLAVLWIVCDELFAKIHVNKNKRMKRDDQEKNEANHDDKGKERGNVHIRVFILPFN